MLKYLEKTIEIPLFCYHIVVSTMWLDIINHILRFLINISTTN